MKGTRTPHLLSISSMLCILTLLTSFFDKMSVESYPTGPPISPGLCASMTPSHPLSPQSGASDYTLTVSSGIYTSGEEITVTVTTDPGATNFKGLFLQMRREGTEEIVGSWSVSDSTSFKTVSCGDGTNNAVTHKVRTSKDSSLSFQWTPPAGETANLYVVATFVQSYLVYWVMQKGPTIQVSAPDPCNPNKCLSGGTCVPNGDTFTCNCPYPFGGPTCHYITDPCYINECKNGASCGPGEGPLDYTCICSAGFTGELCDEVNVPAITTAPTITSMTSMTTSSDDNALIPTIRTITSDGERLAPCVILISFILAIMVGLNF